MSGSSCNYYVLYQLTHCSTSVVLRLLEVVLYVCWKSLRRPFICINMSQKKLIDFEEKKGWWCKGHAKENRNGLKAEHCTNTHNNTYIE